MARRKHKKHHHRRRRRVGALDGSGLVGKVIGITAGAVAGAYLAKIVGGMVPTPASGKPSVIPALVPIVAGALLPRFVKSSIGVAAGAGLIASGGALAVSRTILPLPGVTGVGYVRPYGRTRSQMSVGAPGFSNRTIGSASDPAIIGALSEN